MDAGRWRQYPGTKRLECIAEHIAEQNQNKDIAAESRESETDESGGSETRAHTAVLARLHVKSE